VKTSVLILPWRKEGGNIVIEWVLENINTILQNQNKLLQISQTDSDWTIIHP
jgi:hypothetical protein